MSSSLNLALNSALSGLSTSQYALNTVANNLANVNTEGYTQKVTYQEAVVLSGTGAGVQVASVQRVVDENLLATIRDANAETGSLEVQNDYYSSLATLFGTLEDNTAISQQVTDMLTALESLALDPTGSVTTSDLLLEAEDLTDRLADLSESLQDFRLQADKDIDGVIDEINELLQTIDETNKEIAVGLAVGTDVTGLQDQRDLALSQLSQYMDISTFNQDNGAITVYTTSGTTLVGNSAATLSYTPAAYVTSSMTEAEGSFSGITVNTGDSSVDITGSINEGELAGLLEVRDSVIPSIQSQLDEFAQELRDAVNLAHNAGTAYPGASSLSGTTTFIDPSNQSLTWDGTDDTRLVIFDSSGNQVDTTTMRTLLGSDTGTVQEIADAMNTWLSSNGYGSASIVDGQLTIETTGSYGLGIVDETAVGTEGADSGNATLYFNADGSNATADSSLGVTGADSTATGFSNFFGLNDFFTDSQSTAIYESAVQSRSAKAQSDATLTFTDETGTLGSVSITSGMSLTQIAAAIEAADIGVSASVIPDEDSYRLRITNNDGYEMVITEADGDTLLQDLGIDVSNTGLSASLEINEDILEDSDRLALGAVQWDADAGLSGEYYLSSGDVTTVDAMVSALTDPNDFDATGGLSGLSVSLIDYAASIVSDLANTADFISTSYENQAALTESLQFQADSISGVNTDEQLAEIFALQQAYAASAQVLEAIQEMFETLESVV